ncbi:MAG: hypothetical protein JKY13_03080, partial [Gammaproteobacteria bacterium]|nr:hypothetical protein [Gammaproteobacteria bacterium]
PNVLANIAIDYLLSTNTVNGIKQCLAQRYHFYDKAISTESKNTPVSAQLNGLRTQLLKKHQLLINILTQGRPLIANNTYNKYQQLKQQLMHFSLITLQLDAV